MFLIPEDGELIALAPTAYAAESDLQALLARHPELLAGNQISPEDPRRWLLINREQGLADNASLSSRWSVDHLFIDHDAVPTIVEVKRSSNTQIRREVVGQMLDYAANGLRYWPVENLRSDLVARLEREGMSAASDAADGLVRDLVGGAGPDAADPVPVFWARVDDNLSAGRLRLLFVADVIPPELVSVIEFLNDQMTRTEVLGVEVRQFTRGRDRLVAPRIVGRTREATKTKRQEGAISLDDLISAAKPETREVGRLLAELADARGWIPRRRPKSIAYDDAAGLGRWCTWYPTYDSVEFYIGALADAGAGDVAEQLLESLARVTGGKVTSRNPGVACSKLLATWDAFSAVWLPEYEAAALAARSAL